VASDAVSRFEDRYLVPFVEEVRGHEAGDATSDDCNAHVIASVPGGFELGKTEAVANER